MMGEKREVRPVLLKFGMVLAFSLGGILYSYLRSRRINPPRSSSPRPQSSPGHGSHQADIGKAKAKLRKDDSPISHGTFSSCSLVSVAPGDDSPSLSRSSVDNIGCNFSPSSRSTEDKDAYLLPEFNNLVKEFDLSAIKACFSPRKDVDVSVPCSGPDEKLDHELEIRILRNTVRTLKERERSLEIQLFECHGMKEQETAVMELQNRLKLNNMEAKLFNLKIETLQADKRRLEEQVADNTKVVSELESAKAKIKLLKKKLKFEAEQNKGLIMALQEKIVKLQEQENKVLFNSDIQLKSQKIKELEEEAQELRKTNDTLQEENSALAQKIECLQNLVTSVLEDEQKEALEEENRQLKQKNEDLNLDIERLQADRCTDIEELVYLRWINACLRYELRNYQPGSGKTMARDLSKTLSPKSEEKAKQLILEYAQKEGGNGEKGMITNPDFGSDQWSSSQSNLTDSGEYDDSSVDFSSHGKPRKSKIFGKLMTLLRGKDSRHRKGPSSLDGSTHFEDSVGRSSCDFSQVEVLNTQSTTSSQNSSRRSLDLQKSPYLQESSSGKGDDSNHLESIQRNSSDGSSSSVYKVIGQISKDPTNPPEEDQNDQGQKDGEKSDLVKYAAAFTRSHRKASSNKRLTSYLSF